MKEIIETHTINGFAVHICHDDWAENPREWSGYSSTLCMAHRKYTFGGEQLPWDCASIGDAFAEFLGDRGLTEKDVIWLPVYLYDHSGLALSTTPFSCTWDSGQLGFIYETRADIRKEFAAKRISAKLEAQIENRLCGEIEELGHWANGEVYRLVIPELDFDCGGFYGWDHEASGLLEYAREEIDAELKKRRKAHFERLKQLIRSKVALQYRPALPA